MLRNPKTKAIKCHIEYINGIYITIDSKGRHPTTGYELYLHDKIQELEDQLRAYVEIETPYYG